MSDINNRPITLDEIRRMCDAMAICYRDCVLDGRGRPGQPPPRGQHNFSLETPDGFSCWVGAIGFDRFIIHKLAGPYPHESEYSRSEFEQELVLYYIRDGEVR